MFRRGLWEIFDEVERVQSATGAACARSRVSIRRITARAWVVVIAAMLTFVAAAAAAAAPRTPDYVTTAVCASCHQAEHAAWTGSHHDWALRAATPEWVLGDFEDAEFTQFGITSRFTRRGTAYFVETEGPDGSFAEFEVLYAVGVTPLQQYLVALEGGRLQALGLAWDVPGRRWFHLYPDREIAPGDPLHWTGRLQNWNSQCAECHSTDFVKGYDPETRSYKSLLPTWIATPRGFVELGENASSIVAFKIKKTR